MQILDLAQDTPTAPASPAGGGLVLDLAAQVIDPFGPDKKRRAKPAMEREAVIGQAMTDTEELIKMREAGGKPYHPRTAEVMRRMAAAADNPVVKTSRPGASTYTTQYAIDWGRSNGWKLLDRERYDHRLKRHNDLQLGSDAMFEGPDGLILVQGAGRYERAAHRQRFDERGGEAKARHRHLQFVYVEFERGNKTPILEEWWS